MCTKWLTSTFSKIGKRSADEVANDTPDEASKKQKITTMTTHGDENEVLRQIISKERLARTTASVLRGNKVSQNSFMWILTLIVDKP